MRLSMLTSKTKFWTKLLALFLAVILFSGACSLLADRCLSHGFLYSYADKLESLKNTQGQKTVFVGGSSVLFGVSAEEYEKLSGKPAINMGLNAGAYDVYLSSILPYINQGDTVVLALEFEAYNDKWYKYDEIYLDVANSSEGYYKNLPALQKPVYFFKQSLRSCNKVFDVAYSIIQEKLDDDGQLYVRKNIKSNGDFNSELTSGTKKISPHEIKDNLKDEALKEVLRYTKLYENKGAKVHIAYPPCYSVSHQDVINNIDKTIRQTFGSRVIGNINDWILSTNDYFFDTAYHLNSEGVVKHTKYYHDLINQQ